MVSAGSNTLWLYFSELGGSIGLSDYNIGNLGTLSVIPTLCVPFIANFIFKLTKSIVPLGICCALSGVMSYWYVNSKSEILFSFVVVSMTFLYILILGLIRMYSTWIDGSGKTTAAIGGSDYTGMVLGPLIASNFIDLNHDYLSLGFFGVLLQSLCLLPCAIIIFSSRKLIRKSQSH